MPEIDQLMQVQGALSIVSRTFIAQSQVWPNEVEALTGDSNINLPSADLDINLESYVDVLCSILDIPVYKSRVQALHVMFTLFSAFKQSEHFGQYQFNEEGNA